MKFLLYFAILAVPATFTLANENPLTSSPPPPEASKFLNQPNKNIRKSSYYCNEFIDCKHSLGTFSSCNSAGICVCDMGYEERLKNGSLFSTSCQKRSCTDKHDCTSIYGLNSNCTSLLGKNYCVCDSGYTYDLIRERCVIDTSAITTTYNCKSYDDCELHLGTFSSCNSAGRCVCDMGYERKLKTGGSTCQKMPSCKIDSDCRVKYGRGSRCNFFGNCICDSDYSYNLKEEKCIRNFRCNHDSECHLGASSRCNSDGRCVCDMGYEEKNGSCQIRSCTNQNNCEVKFGINSFCAFEMCQCSFFYYYDLKEEKCVYKYSYHHQTNYGLIVGLPLSITSFVVIIVAIILVRRRKLQAEAARMAALQRGGVQNPQNFQNPQHPQHPQHPQNPQHPQPVYNHPQQNPHQQSLPPFNPTYQPKPSLSQQPAANYQQPSPPGVYPSVTSPGGHYPNLN